MSPKVGAALASRKLRVRVVTPTQDLPVESAPTDNFAASFGRAVVVTINIFLHDW